MTVLPFSADFHEFLTAIYTVYTSPNHPSVPNHLPTLIVTPHGALRSDSRNYRMHLDTLLGLQDNLQISSTRIFTQTMCEPVSKIALKGRSNPYYPNRTQRTTCSHLPPKAIYVLRSSSRPAALALESPLLRILGIQLGLPKLFVVKRPETSNGPSPTPVSLHLFTSSLCLLRILQIFPCFKFPSRTQMLRFGVCSILPMRDTISHLSGLNSERSRRIRLPLMGQGAAEPESVSPGKLPKKRQCGRLLARATRIASNGWSCARPSTSLSKFGLLAFYKWTHPHEPYLATRSLKLPRRMVLRRGQARWVPRVQPTVIQLPCETLAQRLSPVLVEGHPSPKDQDSAPHR